MKTNLPDLHIHAIVVHFTNALYPVAVFFLILFLFFDKEPFRQTYFHLIVLATLSVPVSYLTGLFTWKEKYKAARVPLFLRKIRYGLVVFTMGCVCSLWYWVAPDILINRGVAGLVFLLLNFTILLPVTYLGHLGGKIVFDFKR